ncbi:hypothetical protein MRBLMI12_000436 [Microbacterium sp. LMI12-1-1.1]|uniref:hypothetical protein n=1 Tax=Microbacterium sp. LMI12-1-1.1 TaxID=3135225 RepID=UPI00344375F6
MSTTPTPAIMPTDWQSPPHGIRIALSPLDEFDMPMDRRGIIARVPSNPRDHQKYAADIAESVRRTILFILTGIEPETEEATQ